MAEPKFKTGDVVQHRASRERAVVVRCGLRCATHQGPDALGITHMAGLGCEWEFNGKYELSLGMAATQVWMPEFLLEPSYEVTISHWTYPPVAESAVDKLATLGTEG